MNLIYHLRKHQEGPVRRVVFAFWTLCIINLFGSPIDKPIQAESGSIAFTAAHAPVHSILEELISIAFSGVNPYANLSDGVGDSADTLEFIVMGHCLLHDVAPAKVTAFIVVTDQLFKTDLNRSTPPPEIG